MIQIAANNQIKIISPENRINYFDFNAYYEGYYPKCRFTASASGESLDLLAGTDEFGIPHLFARTGKTIWEERNIATRFQFTKKKDYGDVKTILIEEKLYQIFLVCENGYLITIPDCSQCVRAWHISDEKLKEGWIEQGKIYLCDIQGKEFSYSVSAAAQFRCTWSFAEPYIRDGCILLDLRASENRKSFKIPYAVSCTRERLEVLMKGYPKEKYLFFVCERGMKSDEAARLFRERGLQRTFSLGGEGDIMLDLPGMTTNEKRTEENKSE